MILWFTLPEHIISGPLRLKVRFTITQLIYNLQFTDNKLSIVTRALSVNTSSGEICFFSIPQTCSLACQTLYNVSISDSTGDVIFENGSIPESTCVIVSELLHSLCGPFMISAQPFNHYNTVLNSINQQIRMGQLIVFTQIII